MPSYSCSQHGNTLLLLGLTLICFSNHHSTESEISLCVQISGHGRLPLICDKSHFCIACNFLRPSAGSSARMDCRCGVSECTCDLLVAWRPVVVCVGLGRFSGRSVIGRL